MNTVTSQNATIYDKQTSESWPDTRKCSGRSNGILKRSVNASYATDIPLKLRSRHDFVFQQVRTRTAAPSQIMRWHFFLSTTFLLLIGR